MTWSQWVFIFSKATSGVDSRMAHVRRLTVEVQLDDVVVPSTEAMKESEDRPTRRPKVNDGGERDGRPARQLAR